MTAAPSAWRAKQKTSGTPYGSLKVLCSDPGSSWLTSQPPTSPISRGSRSVHPSRDGCSFLDYAFRFLGGLLCCYRSPSIPYLGCTARQACRSKRRSDHSCRRNDDLKSWRQRTVALAVSASEHDLGRSAGVHHLDRHRRELSRRTTHRLRRASQPTVGRCDRCILHSGWLWRSLSQRHGTPILDWTDILDSLPICSTVNQHRMWSYPVISTCKTLAEGARPVRV